MSKLLLSCTTVARKQSLIYNQLSAVRHVSTSSRLYQQAEKKPSAEKAVESPSFAMNLFRGELKLSEVFPYPSTMNEEQTETLQALVDPTARFFEENVDATANDLNEKVPDDVMQGLKDLGAFGLQVPTEYDGLGLNNTQYARLTEIVGSHDLGIGITMGAHQSIGFKGIIIAGNEAQKAKYLPKLATGETIAAFALTEPSSGSDASSIRTRAELSEDGKHWIMNGQKIWISGGGLAEIFTVFAQTPVKDEVTGEVKDKITAFIVERAFGGVTNGKPEKKMGIKCSNTVEVYFENVKIPVENVLGGVGNGFKVSMNILNAGRFGMSAALSGTMKAAIKQALAHATQRVQFGKTIISYGTTQEKFARMAMLQYVTESMAYMLSNNMDRGSPEYQLEAAMSKVYGSEAAWWVIDECIQVLGGMGYMRDSGIERVQRDLRIFRIFEGANDILRLFVALTGMNYAGKHLRELQKKVQSFDLGVIMSEGKKRLGSKVGMSQVQEIPGVPAELKKSAELAQVAAAQFGETIEKVLIKHGKKIVEEQFVVNRVAQSTIDVYAMFVVLSRASRSINNKSASAEHEANIVNLFCAEASKRVANNLKDAVGPELKANSKLMQKISKDLEQSGQVVAEHPLGF